MRRGCMNMHANTILSRVWALLSLSLLLNLGAGCASTEPRVETYDPYENANRSFHTFNNKFDRVVMKPIVDKYVDVTPENVRLSVSNFFDNLTYPNVVLHSFLQGKIAQGFSDTGRFAVNSTVGVAGLFDAATVLGLEEHNEDLGQTLAVWGVSEGPYLDLPFFGPTNTRDLPDMGGSVLTNVLTYVGTPVIVAGVTATAPLIVLGVIDKRARAESALRARDDLALDTYVFTREAYLQRRTFLIHDGNPPIQDTFAEFEDFENEAGELEEESMPEEESSLLIRTSGESRPSSATAQSINGVDHKDLFPQTPLP